MASPRGFSEPPKELLDLIGRLKTDLSDYRDYQISHEKSPRTMKGTVFSLDDPSSARIVSNQLYPTAKDAQVESRSLGELQADIDAYLKLIVGVDCNESRSDGAAAPDGSRDFARVATALCSRRRAELLIARIRYLCSVLNSSGER